MKSLKNLLNEASISGDPDKMGLPYANTLAQHVNVTEIPSGSNRSPEIDRYLKLTGLNNVSQYEKKGVGYPWCMAFVYAMFDDFVNSLGLPNPLPKTAAVMKHWNKADLNLKISIGEARTNPSLVKPGQVFIQSRGPGQGHTGIVTAVDIDKGTFKTIEGNTNDQLSGEGHRVGRNTRKLSQSSLIGFVDYFKGNRNRQFEETISKVVANAATDYSPSESKGGFSIDQIKNVQTVLKAAGYDLGEFGPNKDGIDGDLGSKTKAALKDWKSKNKMPPDDILDNNTYEAIVKKSNINMDSNADAKTRERPIEKLIKAVLPKLFLGKEVKLDNFNISKDPNFEIKKAIVEGLYCFKSLNGLLNEQVNFSDLKSKLRSIKKSFDTGTSDAYRGNVNNSPIENPNVLDQVTGTSNTLKVFPEVLFIYDKQNDKFYIKAANSQAIDLIGSDKEVEVDREQLGTIANSFEISKEVETPQLVTNSPTKEVEIPQPVMNNPTLEGQPVVPTSDSDKAQKGATIAKKLVADLGLTKEQASGVVGNLWAESGLVPDRIQGSGMKRGILPQAGNGGYGWAQYTHNSLKTDLINFAKGKGVDLNTQPLTDELNYEYLKHWVAKNSNKLNALKSTKDIRSATDYFLKQYERPANQSEAALNKRAGFANTVYNQMA